MEAIYKNKYCKDGKHKEFHLKLSVATLFRKKYFNINRSDFWITNWKQKLVSNELFKSFDNFSFVEINKLEIIVSFGQIDCPCAVTESEYLAYVVYKFIPSLSLLSDACDFHKGINNTGDRNK